MTGSLHAFTMSITPFDSSGRLDEAALRRHLRRQREAGVSVYVGGSGSGEGNALSFEERDRILAIAVEELKGKTAVRAMGCEPRITSEIVEFVKRAEHFKVDAVHVYSLDMGHGAKPTKAEMERYYSTAIEATSLPVILSSHRAAGYSFPLDLLEALLERFPQIAGFSYGGPDIGYLADAIGRFADRIEILCSGPQNVLTVLGLGGHGFMGHEGNIAPQLTSSLIAAYAANDRTALRDAFRKVIALKTINDRFGGSTIRSVKPLMNALGFPAGSLRPPRQAIGDRELAEVVAQVKALNIAELMHAAAVRGT